MLKGVNKAFILGTVFTNPEVKYTTTGKPVATIIVATETAWKDKLDGRLNSRIEWHKIVLYGKIAENAMNYVKKGIKIYIEGSFKSNRWQDKDNITRYNTEIIAINLQILDFSFNTNDDKLFDKSNNDIKKNKNLFEKNIPSNE